MIPILLLCLVASVWCKPADYHNPMINEGLFEGDIMGIDPFTDRNAVPRDNQRWPGGVFPYVIDPSLASITDNILKSMKHIQDKTCIRFVPRTNQKDYVRLYKGTGCWSFWGYLGRGQQDLSLGNGCNFFGTIVHEILHALGFEHEHNRSDRDDHLIINWENIEQKWQYAFNKLRPDQNRLLTSFDFDSVMLYGQYSFSKQHGVLKSMEAKNGKFMDEPYNKPGMSAADVKRVQMLYKC